MRITQLEDLMIHEDATKTTLQIWGSGEELQKKIMKIYNGLVKFGAIFYLPDYYRDNDPHIIVIRTPNTYWRMDMSKQEIFSKEKLNG